MFGRHIRNIIKESLDDLDWIRSSESGFDPNFEFKNFEYWVDLSTLTDYELTLVRDYILKVLSDINLSGDRARKFSNLRSYRGIIIHCGSDTTDYQPEKNNLCFMDIPFEEDENIENSIYVDGREVLGYIKYTEEDEELDESLEWVDKDNTYGGDERFSTDPTWKGDDNWSTNPERSYWKQGDAGSSGGGEDVNESDEDWSWLEDTGEHPSYNGHPQGVVYLRDHDEIDEFCDIIENYNGGELPRGGARENLHSGLENSRDELEGSDYDPSNAVLSASFFVERKIPGILSVGYWGYDVGHYDITEWLSYEDTFNQEYHLYTNLNQVREIFKDYQNPKLIKESEEDWGWIDDIKPINDGWDLYRNKLIGDTFTISLKPEVMSDGCVDEYFPYGVDYGTEVRAMLVELMEPKMTIVTNGCHTKVAEVLLLKFDEGTDGHGGTTHYFSGEKNGEIDNICDNRCWWVYPGLINVNY
jgi:hypothetical protein